MSAQTTIRPCRPDDLDAVRAILRQCYADKAPSEALFRWRHFAPPRVRQGFMVAEVDGQIAGLQPMEVFPFHLGDQPLWGALLTDVAVHPAFRRRGLFTALVEACERRAWDLGADFVTTMPNHRSYPGFLKMGYVDLGRRDLFTCVLSARLLAPAVVRPAALGTLAALAAAPIAALLFRQRAPRHSSVQPTRSIDAALDAPRTSAPLLPGLQLARSAAWWRWRYLDSPERRYLLTEARDSQNQLVGLAVGTVRQHERHQVGYLVDVWGAHEEGILDAIAGLLQQMRQSGIGVVASVNSSPVLNRLLRRAGFLRVPQWLPVKRFHTVLRWNPQRHSSMPPGADSVANWHLTLGDWDNI